MKALILLLLTLQAISLTDETTDSEEDSTTETEEDTNTESEEDSDEDYDEYSINWREIRNDAEKLYEDLISVSTNSDEDDQPTRIDNSDTSVQSIIIYYEGQSYVVTIDTDYAKKYLKELAEDESSSFLQAES
ncbi:unnamed protein product [Blepharisma stoltei]|uniref:Uncharacterized protein n=1 Tax=Blepharisma stoltei TaxID=1481888 RepID=A0AAU9JK78_9CILI|nr:unnamed protein product [Blepharisma stoltei]